MGADLYIQSIFIKQQEKYEPQFNEAVKKRDAAKNDPDRRSAQRDVDAYYEKMYAVGYFRDSYNKSNLLHQLGLDYWKWLGKKLDSENVLRPAEIETVLRAVKEKKLPEYSDKGEARYFAEKKKRLISFLQTAIKLNEGIYCSI